MDNGGLIMVKIDIDITTFATLLAGLYISYKGADINTIPTVFWLQLATELAEHMPTWKYDVQTLEDWIANYLIITVKEILTESEIEEMKAYPIYVELGNGNATLIGAGDLVWCSSTSEKEY